MEITHHAEHRISQRGIAPELVAIVMRHGTRVFNGGCLFIFMRQKDVPANISGSARDKLEGITLLLDPTTKRLITAYRNRNALRDIKRKRKYYCGRES